jgi:hypothetical protein
MEQRVMNLKELFESLWNFSKAGSAIDHPDGGKVVLLANGTTLKLDPVDKALSHVKQGVTLGDAHSFSDYFNRFKNADSVILADDSAHPPKIRGVIDYHLRPDVADGHAIASYGNHYLNFSPVYSEQYARWRDIDERPMAQVAFLEFLQENYLDVVAPDSAQLLEQVMNLEAKTDVTFKSKVRLSDGSTAFTYNEEVKTGSGTIEGRASFPSELKISVPMFVGDVEPVEMECFLRFKITQGALAFSIKIKRRDLVERERVQAMIEELRKVTVAPVFAGRLG